MNRFTLDSRFHSSDKIKNNVLRAVRDFPEGEKLDTDIQFSGLPGTFFFGKTAIGKVNKKAICLFKLPRRKSN
ncbi:hypothetical protein [Holdemania filiformis]|uniref:hypothetical protein n=1 Tax=Holdemania filiformis TaxID=61171 RepID=UPI002677498A|nr:hypothetical protein [Holdemania filiformis]